MRRDADDTDESRSQDLSNMLHVLANVFTVSTTFQHCFVAYKLGRTNEWVEDRNELNHPKYSSRA